MRNRKYTFHGAFTLKKDADKKAEKVGGKVTEIRVNGKPRFSVYTKH